MSAEVIEGVGDVVDVADEIAAEMTAAAACYQEVGVVIEAILNLPFISLLTLYENWIQFYCLSGGS